MEPLDILAKIDEIAKEASTTNSEVKVKAKKPKLLDIVFLDSIKGTYEIKIITDSSAELFEKLDLHMIPLINSKKKTASVICTGDDCPLCNLHAKLKKLKYPGEWKFKKRKLIKLLIKTGNVSDITSGNLIPGQVYVAYVGEAFYKSLINFIQLTSKYYKNDLVDSLSFDKTHGGIVVTATKSKAKSTTYNFNYVNELNIPAINPKDTFGSDTFELKNLGPFRASYVNKENLELAKSALSNIVLKLQSKNSAASVEMTPDESTKEVNDDPWNVEIPSKSVDSSPVTDPKDSVESNPVPKGLPKEEVVDPTSNTPECFGNFDLTNNKCNKGCEHKRECCIRAVELGKL